MKNKKAFALLLLWFSVFLSSAVTAQTSKTLEWEDLIPPVERLALDAWESEINLTQDFALEPPANIGKVRPELDGDYIKIAGFVIPLEGDEESISEMLLVPYFGACFHVPPPPKNQIIHVTFKNSVKITEIWDVVYVKGKLKTESFVNELAEVGYVMEGDAIETYEE